MMILFFLLCHIFVITLPISTFLWLKLENLINTLKIEKLSTNFRVLVESFLLYRHEGWVNLSELKKKWLI